MHACEGTSVGKQATEADISYIFRNNELIRSIALQTDVNITQSDHAAVINVEDLGCVFMTSELDTFLDTNLGAILNSI